MSQFLTDTAELTEFRYFEIFFGVILDLTFVRSRTKNLQLEQGFKRFYTEEPLCSPNKQFLADETIY